MPSRTWVRYRAAHVGPAIRNARHTAEVSAEELASRIGVTENCLLRWERGQVIPSISALVAIACALGIRVADLVEECDA